MNKKINLFFAIVLLSICSLHAQPILHAYSGRLFSCKYHIASDMLDGKYTSYYKNGVKKSEGEFKYGNKAGEWTVWDSTGKLRVKRIYSNPFEYRQVVPVVSSEGPIPLLDKPLYTLQRDSSGKWIYYNLAERMVAYQQRNFKCFYTSSPQVFFDCKTLFNILYTNAKKKNISLYLGKKGDEDDTYSVRLNLATSDSSLIDSTKFRLVGFRVKSDWIFDNSRFVSDERPLFLTPLVVYKTSPKDTTDLFSVYVPDVRKYLVQVKLTSPDLPSYLQNLDDVFVFGCFGVVKWNKSNIYDRAIYTYTMPSSANKYLLNEVETENDLWLHFNK
ncbi:MAG TPA: hypothetical protein VK809_02530 [Bacteroidia bacterium]|nr:hypothetical protein [Bacteroidia bacterium]